MFSARVPTLDGLIDFSSVSEFEELGGDVAALRTEAIEHDDDELVELLDAEAQKDADRDELAEALS